MTNATEHIFFEDGGLKVTSARFMARGETYALAGITSVKQEVEPANRNGALICGVIGVLLLLSKSTFILGIPLLIAAVLWWRALKDTYVVKIQSASGAKRAYADKDAARIAQVVAALNDAIVHRG